MRTIDLTRGFVAIVDDEDYARVSGFKWYLHGCGFHGYYARTACRKLMHRFIISPPNGLPVDHKNGDKPDNRKSNLRVCTVAGNQHNRGARSDNTSGFKGVSFHKSARKWVAVICLDSKNRHLGCFATKEDAARAYNEAAIILHGAFAKLNTL